MQVRRRDGAPGEGEGGGTPHTPDGKGHKNARNLFRNGPKGALSVSECCIHVIPNTAGHRIGPLERGCGLRLPEGRGIWRLADIQERGGVGEIGVCRDEHLRVGREICYEKMILWATCSRVEPEVSTSMAARRASVMDLVHQRLRTVKKDVT